LVPFAYLTVVGAVALAAVAAAGIGVVRATRRHTVEIVRDL
jgi:hypothetical protein